MVIFETATSQEDETITFTIISACQIDTRLLTEVRPRQKTKRLQLLARAHQIDIRLLTEAGETRSVSLMKLAKLNFADETCELESR